MLTVILIATVLIGLALLPAIRQRFTAEAASAVRPASPAPSRSASPAPVFLVLRAAAGCSCDASQRLADQTFERGSAPKLPLAGCSRSDCRCQIETITDRRRKPRRESVDRRDSIRFSDKPDRRVFADRRRQNAIWTSHTL